MAPNITVQATHISPQHTQLISQFFCVKVPPFSESSCGCDVCCDGDLRLVDTSLDGTTSPGESAVIKLTGETYSRSEPAMIGSVRNGQNRVKSGVCTPGFGDAGS